MAQDTNPPANENIYRVTRRIKKTEQTIYNALRSIHDDSLFVSEIRHLWRELPLLANLRCGLWYSSDFDGTCYFKSTDGHNGNWSFNTGRMNLHVAMLAAERGGCFIVDATRKGKRFPDAMSKTIPIWACVLNRALADYRTLHAQEMLDPSAEQTGNGHLENDSRGGGKTGNSDLENDWDCSLHLPVWISHVEKGNIESRIQSWVESLKSTVVDLETLAKTLKKPLRPLWISQSSVIWLNELPEVDEWSFTPIILVSASRPSIFTQRYTDEDFSWSYIPGAADDEESWARGLTPALFWTHHLDILEGGPTTCNAKVAEIVERDRVYRAQRGIQAPQVRVKSGRFGSEISQSADRECTQHETALDLMIRNGPAEGDGRAFRAEGEPTSESWFIRKASLNLKGFHWIGNTGLAVGNEDCGNRDDIFGMVDCVINCGASSNPTCRSREESYLYLPIVGSKIDRHSLQDHLQEALSFAKQKLSCQKTVLIYCSTGEDISVCVCLAVLLSCYTTTGGYSGSSNSDFVVTKSAVRQQLIYLSAFNSDARPSRGSLRQVFNFFNPNVERVSQDVDID
ncbi:tRNA A64-2'-O-ribosylphosphate transferase [Marchantia polymorpha subsp. ruderalis]|uniref:Initiator tRNA phosphoribosyl transferase n=2 Tax=Marchantia polymorpha TaxID=3197 RepID=A0AAF6AU86_MARPO|nr:hypothetical protein MARPO_0002s0306 [Marchantia polymorpha]BBN00007.1 hypothetical protein Mp_1g25650 [Marchantia polymorpha subsp. ruderalis]|eukprot:PTQ49871.1 hypothetical protein MARPO_0002s0306 [Marchantia polymorpha]